MATAFEGLGLGMLGSEKRFMTPKQSDEPTVGSILLASLLDALHGKRKEPLPESQVEDRSKYAVPPAPVVSPVTPPTAGVAPEPAAPTTIPSEVDHPDTENVLKDLNLKTSSKAYTSPDQFVARNPAQDQVPSQMAVAPPQPQMKLPDYSQGGGGINPSSVLSTLATLFV